MRRKSKSSKKITSLLVAFALAISMVVLPSTALTANAAEIGKPSEITVDRLGLTAGSTIMFGENQLQSLNGIGNPVGTPDGNPIKWRVAANDGTTLTLLADNKLGNRQYDPVSHQLWSGSDICNYLNGTDSTVSDAHTREYATSGGFLQNSFSAGEQSAMVAQYSTMEEPGYTPSDKYTANQTIVLPSVDEVKNASSGGTWSFANSQERNLLPSNIWWLRSTGYYDNSAARVGSTMNVPGYNFSVDSNIGIRPAFKINLTSVIFSSSAAGGKPTEVGAGLDAASQPIGAVKLTVKDPIITNLDLTIAPADQVPKTAVQGETISIPYTGAVVGTGKTVSCVVENSSDGIKYYAKLATAANGTANIDIPTDMQVGSYTLRLFNEQDNGVNKTDFASDPIDIALTVNYAPVSITSQPANSTIIEGSNASFSVTATGSAPISYQWEESSDGGSSWNPIAGETSATLTLDSVPIASNGKQYHCVVNNPVNMPVTSNSATLTVNVTPTTPTVTPTSLSMQEGATGSFSVTMGTGTDRATSVAIASDDITIATVDTSSLTANDNATVIGVAAGTANINLTWTDGSKDGTTDTVAVTVTALPPNSYAVTFDPSSGTVVSGSLNQTITHGSSAVAPVLDRSGHTFDGWDKDFSNITTNITVTAQWKQIPPAGINHTITLGTSGDGTVTGGGDYAENTTATVTATANAGNSFVSWTENGTVVAGAGASYSFAVTADRTLVANFKADDAPEPPVIIYPSGSGHSSSSGGSSTPDVVRVSGRAFTKAEATKLFAAALAAKPEGATTLSIKARNYTSADKAVLAELAALAQKNGVTLTVHFDTVVGKAVTYRMSVNPDLINTNLDLTAKIVGGKITLPRFNPAVEVAVKMPEGITIETLKITQNGKDITATAKLWLDKNGYMHFTTTGGEIVLGK